MNKKNHLDRDFRLVSSVWLAGAGFTCCAFPASPVIAVVAVIQLSNIDQPPPSSKHHHFTLLGSESLISKLGANVLVVNSGESLDPLDSLFFPHRSLLQLSHFSLVV
ncbi:hypothetical protein P152DRAFT_298799 [Eremomyces bilateralis CBS 781.70]|uniref:Uncharacterized protein n=1 Tax=Eremomyces bilateralis CBS 781.70 TaxID=1392243 RepID=A0A6G1G7B4_9PEZI|nr:uncharacterized protein P152DRAFT_298799 [Eremomyces bilateralis CBS 781.70]KAF1813943.1 hypothetical protein P152DRAFT_298799 [Eremomyces bilateralis CBS 781.70]